MISLPQGSKLKVVNNSITPTHAVHEIITTDSPVIDTIIMPGIGYCEMLILICNSGEFSLGIKGNIGRFAVCKAGACLLLVFNPKNGKWASVCSGS